MRRPDLIALERYRNLLSSIPEEMGMVLMRTGYSPNIKERRDFSCAVFDSNGDLVAQAAHLPVHLGSTPQSVKAAMTEVDMEKGDCVILNDPYRGGTHLPDITMVEPLFAGGDDPSFYVANRAHHCDVGGRNPGSMGLARCIEDEGVIIPPTRVKTGGEIRYETLKRMISRMRNPEERMGDLKAQFAANSVGRRRLLELVRKYSLEEVKFYMGALLDHSERMVRSLISGIPDGRYEAIDHMDDDGITGEKIPIGISITVSGESIHVDFHGSSPQVPGSINAVRAVTLSAVFYVLRCLVEGDIPTNSGIFRPIHLSLPPASVVNASRPAAVAAGNVETSQRITDVLLLAFSGALPEMVPAASQGTMNNVTVGGSCSGGACGEGKEEYTYYETIGGGSGAGPGWNGESAVHSHMTNTLNTPIEALEHVYPIRVTRYAVRRGSGGTGIYRGGDGIVREYEFLDDAEVTMLSERRRIAPWGLQGGEDGERGRNVLIRDGRETVLPGKVNLKVRKGDRVRIETPGGGGYGRRRDPAECLSMAVQDVGSVWTGTKKEQSFSFI